MPEGPMEAADCATVLIKNTSDEKVALEKGTRVGQVVEGTGDCVIVAESLHELGKETAGCLPKLAPSLPDHAGTGAVQTDVAQSPRGSPPGCLMAQVSTCGTRHDIYQSRGAYLRWATLTLLVLAHMDAFAHELEVIVAGIRAVLPTVPVQIIAGHSHRRQTTRIDGRAGVFEPGNFFNTIG